MALLKAFVCQVVLFGLYKLFLEQIVEEHLVPDELTRNCLVGVVCLMCFGIQVYTDKADDDDPEADESLKEKSESEGAKSAKWSEPSEISAAHETDGSNTSNGLTTHSGIFAQFSPNVIKGNGKGEQEKLVSSKNWYDHQDSKTIPVLSRFSETNVYEESDDEGIEIDKYDAEESTKKAEELNTVKSKVEPIEAVDIFEESKHLRTVEEEVTKSEHVTEESRQSTVEDEVIESVEGTESVVESECLIANGEVVEAVEVEVIKSEDTTENANLPKTIEDEVEVTEPDEVTEPIAKSECLMANGEDIESMQNLDETTILKIGESSEVTMKNGIAEESLNNIESISNIIEETESKKVEATKPEEVVESECLIANGEVSGAEEVEVIKLKDITEKDNEPKAIIGEVDATKHKVAEPVVESECLMAEDISSTKNPDNTTTLKTGESSEAQMENGIVEESLNNIDSSMSNIIEETESKKQDDEGEIENGQEVTLSSEADEYTNDIKKSLAPSEDACNSNATSTKIVNDVDTTNKNDAETSTLVITTVPSTSEKLKASTTRQKVTVAADMCTIPVTVDISFIYACH